MNRSYYFVIDGIDGSGKTTQLGKVANYLTERGVSFISTKEPGGTEIGKILRDILISKKYDLEPETELLLYSADRIEHQKKVVIPNLDKGITVLSDRFISSTYAYQVFGRGLDRNLLDILKKVTVLRYPDIIIIIDMPPEIALKRAVARLSLENSSESEGKFESMDIGFFERVREGFFWYAKNFENVVIVDGNRTIEKLFEEIKELLKGFYL